MTIILGGFNTPLATMDRSSRQKINKETLALSDILDQIDLDVYRIFHTKAAEYTFFSSVHETFSRRDHMQGHKTGLSKFKKSEIISSIFYDHNSVKLGIHYKKKKTKILQMPHTCGG